MSRRKSDRPIGRPLKTHKDLVKGWEEKIYEMGREGKHYIHFINYLDISKDTFYRMLKDDEYFSKACKKARSLSEEYWYNLSLNSFVEGDSRKINSGLFQFMVKNAFGWEDSSQVDITTQGESITEPKKFEVEIVRNLKNKGQ